MVVTPKIQLLLLVVLVFFVEYIPLIDRPFKWTVTYFHEISHGLAAILTGGDIVLIKLRMDASGLCQTTGGWRPLISFSGYAGSAVAGTLMYLTVVQRSQRTAKLLLSCFILLLTVSMLLWARDMVTLIILLGLIVIYSLIWCKEWVGLRLFIKFLALFVMLESVRMPLYLLEQSTKGDDVNLKILTHIPEVIWVMIWMLISLFCLFLTYISTNNQIKKST